MAVISSISRFPMNPEAQESCGLPWGITVTPFAAVDERGRTPLRGGAEGGGRILPRCEHCWGYFNTYCDLENWAWTCSLCGNYNGLSAESIKRFSNAEACPELNSSFIDLELEPAEDENETRDIEMKARPVYVAAIDLSSSEEFMELVKSALLAALEALVPGSLFGLLTFSHKIGLYDIQGPIPIVKNVFINPDSESQLEIPLQDVMPLLSFLAPVETCKDRIAAALDNLKPVTSWERNTPRLDEQDGMFMGGRGFGTTMTALVQYLSSQYGETFALARVFAFISGAPDYGMGQLDTRRYGEQYASRREDADKALLPEQTPFYRDLAAEAVQAGVCFDLFAISDEYTDLASLKFLSINSGGFLFYYTNTDDSTLPQDMYRMLSRPYAFGCILKLRTSAEFKPGNSYGHFFPDPQYENVQHIICCDSFATYAYDFKFTNSDGFSRHSDKPIVQVAFQYSVIEPVADNNNNSNDLTSFKFCLKRRLRIKTLEFGVARNINELFDSVNTGAIISILVHKVIIASLEEGVREGRNLLTDWLVILIAQYNEAYKPFDNINNITYDSILLPEVDISFSQCPELQPLPRLIFALLRSSLLKLREEGIHPDYRIYLQCLFSALEPGALQKAVYPLLTSYSTPDQQAYPRHSLSRAALITSGAPIFVLDAFTNIVVYYSSAADPNIPFPPPHECLLRKTINKTRQNRCITSKLTFIKGGKDDSKIFEDYLIEEQQVDGSVSGSNVIGFAAFLQNVSQDVIDYLKQ